MSATVTQFSSPALAARNRLSSMTVVAAVMLGDVPALLGDLVLSYPNQERVEYSGKIYELGPNLAIGWSGTASVATTAIERLVSRVGGRYVEIPEIEVALNELDDMRTSRGLELTGWIVTPEGPKALRWASAYLPTRFCAQENYIGTGADDVRKLLRSEDAARGGNVDGSSAAILQAIAVVAEARFEEMLRQHEWPVSWGVAYDVVAFIDGSFKWVPSVTYVGWDVMIGPKGDVAYLKQAPIVLKQERVHDCTVLYMKALGDPRYSRKLAFRSIGRSRPNSISVAPSPRSRPTTPTIFVSFVGERSGSKSRSGYS